MTTDAYAACSGRPREPSPPSGLAPSDAPARLGLARRLGIESVATATLCQGALLRSIESGVTVYDTLFVELAARTACPLVTFDKAVLKAFPQLACRPRELPRR